MDVNAYLDILREPSGIDKRTAEGLPGKGEAETLFSRLRAHMEPVYRELSQRGGADKVIASHRAVLIGRYGDIMPDDIAVDAGGAKYLVRNVRPFKRYTELLLESE